MKRNIFLIFLVVLILYPYNIIAFDDKNVLDDLYDSQIQSLNMDNFQKYIDSLNKETAEYIPKINIKTFLNLFKSGNKGFNLNELLSGFIRYLLHDVLLNTKLLIELIILALMSAFLHNLESSFENNIISNMAYYACYLVLILIIVNSFTLALGIGKDTINKMIDLMLSLVPILLGLLISVGGVSQAAIFDPLVIGLTNFVSIVIRDFILPLIYLTSVLAIVNNLSDTFKLKKLSGLLKQISIWSLGFTLTIFIGILTIRGSAASTIDQVTLKTAKFAIDNFIPIVGKCLSDAIGTIAGYSLILKDAISAIGLIALVISCVFPLIKIVSMIFIYKLASAVLEPICDDKIVECMNDIGNSMTLVFACVLCVAVMFFIMISIVAATGKLSAMP